ncbi:hypothetical protein GGR53DRAFT_465270 [Hypoxylon sp. FL1150]|nr:hypothetical protein GGR53DRAFT_465270 [Hypoxylon sp. FL1150]
MEPTHAVIDAHGSPYMSLADYLSEHQPEKQSKLMQATTTELDSSDLDTESESEGERSDSEDERDTYSVASLDEASQTITDFGARSGPAPAATLTTLPPEIRHEILKHLLVVPDDASAPSPSAKTYAQPPGLLHAAILRANRQLYAEGWPLLYRGNTFLVHNTLLTELPQLRRAYRPVLSADAASQIERFHVCVRLDAEPGYDREAATRHLSGKEEVVLEAAQSSFQGAGPEVLTLFEGVRGVRRARVVGSVEGFEDYARWLEGAMMRPVGAEVEPFVWAEGKEPEAQSSWTSN